MYESMHHRPVSRRVFIGRIVVHFAAAAGLLVVSLALGIAGYMALEHLTPLDAFLNSAMLLGGMGPVDRPRTESGRFFAGCYALYAGLVFIVAAGLLLAPTLHRVLHKFHWDDTSE